jgi:hypothetical protein
MAVEMRLESRDASNIVLNSGISYDFTIKDYTYTTSVLSSYPSAGYIKVAGSLYKLTDQNIINI